MSWWYVVNIEQTRQDADLYCWKLLRSANESVLCLPANAKSGKTPTSLLLWNWMRRKCGSGLSWRVRRSENDCENWNAPGTIKNDLRGLAKGKQTETQKRALRQICDLAQNFFA
jgi:hypothetical protein